MRVMDEKRKRERIDRARRIFEEDGWGNVELLEGWDGEDLEELRPLLTDEEFQALLDRFHPEGHER
jgi:hypothetical protein